MNLDELKRRIAFILALAVPFSLVGCFSGDKEETEEVTLEDNQDVKKEDLRAFLVQMADIIPIYNLEDIYLSEEQILKVMKALDSNQKCRNTLVDENALYNLIISNSVNEEGLIVFNDSLEPEEAKMRDTKVKEALKKVLKKMFLRGEISTEDACVLKSFKIEIGHTGQDSFMHYLGSENKLIVDVNAFISSYDNFNKEYLAENTIIEGLTRYMEYGINLARLKACDCRMNAGQVNGGINYAKNLNVIEQMAMMDGDNSDLEFANRFLFDNLPQEYNRMAAVLLVLAMFKDNRTVEELESLTFNSNLQGVYNFFGADNYEKVKEFCRIATSIDALGGFWGYEEDYIQETGSTSVLDYRNYIGYAYKASIFKIALEDLMRYMLDYQDLTLEEALFLFKFVKTIVVSNAFTSATMVEQEGYSYTFDVGYSNDILALETIFDNFLKSYYGIDEEKFAHEKGRFVSFSGVSEGYLEDNVDYKKLVDRFPLLEFINENYKPYYSDATSFDESVGRK